MSERDLVKDYDAAYQTAIRVWGPWYTEAKKDIKFRLGDQWNANDRARLAIEMRDPLVFNKTKRVVNLITGYERKNRLALKVNPVEGADDATARQFSGTLQFIMSMQNGYEVMSEGFENGPVVTGLNLVEICLDYADDPVSGDFKFYRVPHNQVLLDPYFTDRSLADCQYILRRRWISREDAIALLPDAANDLKNLQPTGRDGKFTDAAASTNFLGDNLFRVDYFWRRTTKPAKLLVDKLSGAWRVWREKKPQLEAFLQSPDQESGLNIGERVQIFDHQVKSVELAIIVEDKQLYDGPDPLNIDDYPHVALMGYWVPEHDEMRHKLQGVVRCIRDPQTEANRRRLKVLDILDSVISSGFKAKEGSVVNPKALFQTGTQRNIWISKQAQLADVEQLSGGEVPASLFKILEVLDRDLTEIPGANNELFGTPESDNIKIAGVLAKLRQGAGLTTLQDLFDNYRAAKKLLGTKLILAIQNNFKPAKIQRILNEKPSQEFYTRDFSKYDCVPCEGQLTDTQRQMYHAQLLMYKEMGAPISWKSIIQSSSVEFKEEILKEMEAAEQSQAQAGQQQLITKQVTDKLLAAEAAERMAGAEQKTAKIKADIAKAGLDTAKTMAEIQQMDAGRLMGLLQMALTIERQGGLGLPAPPAPQDNVVPMRRGEMLTRR